jgi:hypothetical protein
MKKTFTLTALLFTVIFSSSSYAKITQCEGSYKYWSKPTKLKINIIHPNKDKDYALLSLRDPDDGKFIELLNKGDPVRLGYIEVSHGGLPPERHRIVFTAYYPRDRLVGSYIFGGRMNTLSV